MFSKQLTKSQLRQEHARKIDEFLAHGGKIQQVRPGATGLIDGKYNTRHIVIGTGVPKTRTPIPEVTAAIDARRRKKPATQVKIQPTKRHRKVVFDDFGEPIRTVWIDE